MEQRYLQNPLRLTKQHPLDAKYFNVSGTPYVNTAEVLSEIPTAERHIGLTVNVAGVEYWFTDLSTLVEKKTDLNLTSVLDYINGFFTRQQTTVDLGTTGGTVAVDASLGARFLITTNATTTPAITNALPNVPFVIAYTANHTLNHPTASGVTFKELVRDTPTTAGDKYDCWINYTSATTANYSYIKIN